ncbi:NAD(P)H-binding protein [Parafrankia elaeagni]|uniref:NAD(P)H-binding protein n=1 Tax=Parafrankia elaeagni TaxID=222534 RepID=UPI0003742046|nr:NAD(P)H-binding protein [Parafrankia elaeagni]
MTNIAGSTDHPPSANETTAGAVLVLGGTGKTGRRVAARLSARGLPVRIGSRSGTPPFDWTDPATWAAAVAGIEAMYVVYSPDLSFPAAAPAVRSVCETAVRAGVRRVVLLSQRGEDAVLPSERAVQESGAAWTILRVSWFDQNFSEDYLDGAVRRGEVALPAGTVAEPFIDADDIADVAVAALTSDQHSGRIYDLTGPRLLTFADATAEISRAADREITYRPLTTEAYAAGLAAAGIPADYVTLVTELICHGLDGRNSYTTDDVQHVLGRPATDFTDYVRTTAATGIWST